MNTENSNGLFRAKKNNFTIVSNSILQDNKISLKAKGLYAIINYYLSIPNFELYKSFLMTNCKEGRDNFDKVWKELKDTGYLKIYKIQIHSGKFIYQYELLDEPDLAKEAMETYRLNEKGELIKTTPPHKTRTSHKTHKINIDIDFEID